MALEYTVSELPLTGDVEVFSSQDVNLIGSFELGRSFDPSSHIIELHIYDQSDILLASNYRYRSYNFLQGNQSIVCIDPVRDIINSGFPNGDVRVLYHFLNNLYSPSRSDPSFWIESISSDRTELRLLSSVLPGSYVQRATNNIQRVLNAGSYFSDIRLNFRGNDLLIGINIDSVLYRNQEAVLVKLYEPLPDRYAVKAELSIVEMVSESRYFSVTGTLPFDPPRYNRLAGPNFNLLELAERESTGFLSTNDLGAVMSRGVDDFQADLGIDYSDFSNFIHFSSVSKRVALFEAKRDNLDKTDFDHLDRHLEALSLGDLLKFKMSAIAYDQRNTNSLIYFLPVYIREQPDNKNLLVFVDMLAHYFDNLWIYAKELNNRFNADSALNKGLSKDLVREALRGFGFKVHQNGVGLEALFNHPKINPKSNFNDYQAEIFKRLYHNLPLLLKGRGAKLGLDTLLRCFGNRLSLDLGASRVTFERNTSIDSLGGGEVNILSNYTSVVKTEVDNSINLIRLGRYVNNPDARTFTFDLAQFQSDTAKILGKGKDTSYETIKAEYNKKINAALDSDGLAPGSGTINAANNIFYSSFYGNAVFRTFKDFVPTDAVTSEGIIVAPNDVNISWYGGVNLANYDRPHYEKELEIKSVQEDDETILTDYQKTHLIKDVNYEGAIDVKILGSQFGSSHDTENPDFIVEILTDEKLNALKSNVKEGQELVIIEEELIQLDDG